MKTAAIRIFVTDLTTASEFYGQTLGLSPLGGSPEIGYVMFDGAGIDIILEDGSSEPDLLNRFVGLSFKTSDIRNEVSRLTAAGVEITHPPTKQNWGGMMAHFRDISGNILTLVQLGTTMNP